MRNKTLKKAVIALAIVFGGLLISPVALAAEKNDTNDCINSQTDGWISCSLIDGMKNAIEGLYSWLIENWLAINPKLLSFRSSSDPGYSVFEAWKYFQLIADVLLVVYLIAIIISQVTGMGISNYGVKKALPRVVVAAIAINLSYFICQAAVDLANILGSGIFDVFNNLIESAGIVATGQNNTGYTIALLGILVVVVGVMVGMAAISPSFVMVVLWGFVSAIIAVVFLFVVLGLRQVMAVLLVVVSPIAILCATVPGLRSVYKKWFGLFKGVLLAYPVCSVMIGGGAMAAQILYDVWGGDSNFFAAVACMIICVAPFFFIPSVVKKSVGALDAMVEKVRNGSGAWKGVSGLAQRGLKGSDLNRSLDMASKKKKIYRRAGIRSTFGGRVRRDANGNIMRTRHGGSARYYDAAFSQISRENDIRAFESNSSLVRDRESQAMIAEYESAISGTGKNAEDMSKDFKDLISDYSSKASGSMDDKYKRESLAKMAAYTRILSGTNQGRERLRDCLSTMNSGVTAVSGFSDMTSAMFSGMSQNDIADLYRTDPLLGNYAARITTSDPSVVGAFGGSSATNDNMRYTSEMLANLRDEDLATMDDSIVREMFGQAGVTFGADKSIAPGYSVEDSDYATNLARLAHGVMANDNNKFQASVASQAIMDSYLKQRNSQIESLAGTASSGYRSVSNDPAGLSSLQASYASAAASNSALNMEAIETVLRERGVDDSTIESMRRSAEATRQANAAAGTANRRRANK